jgi:hypothetical protein
MNYDSKLFSTRLMDRFPSGIAGLDIWQSIARDLPRELPSFGVQKTSLRTPRLFVSYKSQDRLYATRLAYLANQEGFEYWMDIINPTLGQANSSSQGTTTQKAIVVASIIEVALLNSSHVIATITNRTAASKGVPYEFGRVKDQTVFADVACSWVNPVDNPPLGEYLFLCPRHRSEGSIRRWLKAERIGWEKRYRTTLRCPASPWSGKVPPKLPGP